MHELVPDPEELREGLHRLAAPVERRVLSGEPRAQDELVEGGHPVGGPEVRRSKLRSEEFVRVRLSRQRGEDDGCAKRPQSAVPRVHGRLDRPKEDRVLVPGTQLLEKQDGRVARVAQRVEDLLEIGVRQRRPLTDAFPELLGRGRTVAHADRILRRPDGHEPRDPTDALAAPARPVP